MSSAFSLLSFGLIVLSTLVDGRRILVEKMEIPSEAMQQMIYNHGYLPNWPYREDMNPFLSHISEGWRLEQNNLQVENDEESSESSLDSSSDENYQFNSDKKEFASLVANTFGK